jgi:hypothetical protein
LGCCGEEWSWDIVVKSEVGMLWWSVKLGCCGEEWSWDVVVKSEVGMLWWRVKFLAPGTNRNTLHRPYSASLILLTLLLDCFELFIFIFKYPWFIFVYSRSWQYTLLAFMWRIDKP